MCRVFESTPQILQKNWGQGVQYSLYKFVFSEFMGVIATSSHCFLHISLNTRNLIEFLYIYDPLD